VKGQGKPAIYVFYYYYYYYYIYIYFSSLCFLTFDFELSFVSRTTIYFIIPTNDNDNTTHIYIINIYTHTHTGGGQTGRIYGAVTHTPVCVSITILTGFTNYIFFHRCPFGFLKLPNHTIERALVTWDGPSSADATMTLLYTRVEYSYSYETYADAVFIVHTRLNRHRDDFYNLHSDRRYFCCPPA